MAIVYPTYFQTLMNVIHSSLEMCLIKLLVATLSSLESRPGFGLEVSTASAAIAGIALDICMEQRLGCM